MKEIHPECLESPEAWDVSIHVPCSWGTLCDHFICTQKGDDFLLEMRHATLATGDAPEKQVVLKAISQRERQKLRDDDDYASIQWWALQQAQAMCIDEFKACERRGDSVEDLRAIEAAWWQYTVPFGPAIDSSGTREDLVGRDVRCKCVEQIGTWRREFELTLCINEYERCNTYITRKGDMNKTNSAQRKRDLRTRQWIVRMNRLETLKLQAFLAEEGVTYSGLVRARLGDIIGAVGEGKGREP